ncbi:MAG: response regulator [Rhodoferax sp.]|nr:response regulator [Rhodoferax sp.]
MKILLVDDARSVVMVMTSRLASYGYDVVHAANGQAAVDMFASAAPDLVLMDIEMPIMNGFEATNRIRAFEATQVCARAGAAGQDESHEPHCHLAPKPVPGQPKAARPGQF